MYNMLNTRPAILAAGVMKCQTVLQKATLLGHACPPSISKPRQHPTSLTLAQDKNKLEQDAEATAAA